MSECTNINNEIFETIPKGEIKMSQTCNECYGSGQVPCPDCGGTGDWAHTGYCEKCQGTGEVSCPQCGGTGTQG